MKLQPTGLVCIASIVMVFAVLPTADVAGQDTEASADIQSAAGDVEAIHESLRELKDRMFAAYEKRDMEALLQDVSDEVVITWQNGERNLGHDEFMDFYKRMIEGDQPIVKEISSQFEVDDLSILYGDGTAVAFGSLKDKFLLTDGSEFTLESKWTATVIKRDTAWQVASFHVSSNIFDNPILSFAQSWLTTAGVGGGLIGLLIGVIAGRLTKRKA